MRTHGQTDLRNSIGLHFITRLEFWDATALVQSARAVTSLWRCAQPSCPLALLPQAMVPCNSGVLGLLQPVLSLRTKKITNFRFSFYFSGRMQHVILRGLDKTDEKRERERPKEGKWGLTRQVPPRSLLCHHLCGIIDQVLVEQDQLPCGQSSTDLLREQPAEFRSGFPFAVWPRARYVTSLMLSFVEIRLYFPGHLVPGSTPKMLFCCRL